MYTKFYNGLLFTSMSITYKDKTKLVDNVYEGI